MIVGILANPTKSSAPEVTRELCALLKEQGIDYVFSTETAELLNEDGHEVCSIADQADMLLVLGGDGTMLHAVNDLGRCSVPVAGLNIGTLGFLTTARKDELKEFVLAIKNGDFTILPRTLLHAELEKKNGEVSMIRALNEITLTRGNSAKLVSLEARVNGELLNHYKADGLIVSTPTGSTAYSLSAGGPLISPTASVFVITPICPHSLSNRSLVLSEESIVELRPSTADPEPILFTADGRDVLPFEAGDIVRVQRAEQGLPLVMLKNRNFYGTLREKLDWG